MRIGMPTSGTVPAVGCGKSLRMPRATACGSASAWAIELTDRTARRPASSFSAQNAGRSFPHDRLQQRHQHGPIAHALGVGREAPVGGEVGPAGDLAELGVLAVVAHRDHHVAVGRGEDLVRHDVLVRVAGAARRLPVVR